MAGISRQAPESRQQSPLGPPIKSDGFACSRDRETLNACSNWSVPDPPGSAPPGRRGGASGPWLGPLRRKTVRGSKRGRNSGSDGGERRQRLIPLVVNILQLLLTLSWRFACMHARSAAWNALPYRSSADSVQSAKITMRVFDINFKITIKHRVLTIKCLLARLAVWESLQQNSSAKHDDRGQEYLPVPLGTQTVG